MPLLILLTLPIIFLSSVWSGFVLSMLWFWFMVPLGATSITIPHAIGLGTIFGLFMGTRGIQREDKGNALDQFSESVAAAIVIPLFMLTIGWAAHSFMVP